jgi:hypothetical protein
MSNTQTVYVAARDAQEAFKMVPYLKGSGARGPGYAEDEAAELNKMKSSATRPWLVFAVTMTAAPVETANAEVGDATA